MLPNFRTALAALLLLSLSAGCMKSLEEQTKKTDNKVLNKKTQEITEFDPKANEKVSDSKVNITNPITGGLEAYGPIMERLSQIHVAPALNLFNAENGRYPNSYDEFMTEIIKKNNIRLPVLPAEGKYKYDVEKHELVVVKAAE